jgi:uncharacterized glyoxalase superfamily protein PhnB
MATQVKPIPEGFHTMTPHLVIRGAAEAIEFYKKAFGAEELVRMPGIGGKGVMHAELKIGNSMMMICEEMPQMGAKSPQAIGGSPVTVHLYVEDVDAAYDRAIKAGASASMAVADMPWGDRYGKLTDPFGHQWSVATHKQDLTPEEIAKAIDAAFCKGPGECCK